MRRIPFAKYTSFGNNFVIVDATKRAPLTEREMADFAYEATNVSFGIGCDNLLVVQACESTVLEEIHAVRGYWPATPEQHTSEFVFRMFEPNGDEAFSCGNGLMSVAQYLYDEYRVRETSIMTEVPMPAVNRVRIGVEADARGSWANMGLPRKVDGTLARPRALGVHDDVIDVLDDVEIGFRAHDLEPYTSANRIKLKGYLVFTGEPHLVIFPDSGLSEPAAGWTIFNGKGHEGRDAPKGCQRVNFGTWLVHRIGCYINTRLQDVFPQGLNVNFACVDRRTRRVEYRCFERGINRETLACGTGALAVAFVARRLGMVDAARVEVLPHRCRWHDADAVITVDETTDGWRLGGRPRKLFTGDFSMARACDAEREAIDDERNRFADDYLPTAERQQVRAMAGSARPVHTV